MTNDDIDTSRLRAAWQGRVSGCLLGKPVEVLSFRDGLQGLHAYLAEANALPLRDYIPLVEGTVVHETGADCCRGRFSRAEPDDDINYTVLALMLLEDFGTALTTEDVARIWLRLLPAGATWTAEREAYRILLTNMDAEFVNGEPPGFDLDSCGNNRFNDWIGAQIRADIYGWVCPGRPGLAADLARRDACLTHRDAGVDGAVFVAALAAAIPVSDDIDDAIYLALQELPEDCAATDAVEFGMSVRNEPDAIDRLHDKYATLPPVHVLNNLAAVVWAVCSANQDFTTAIGNAVSAGWDTDCNGATVGALAGLSGWDIDATWTDPWAGRVGVSLAGIAELHVDELAARSATVARSLLGDIRVH